MAGRQAGCGIGRKLMIVVSNALGKGLGEPLGTPQSTTMEVFRIDKRPLPGSDRLREYFKSNVMIK